MGEKGRGRGRHGLGLPRLVRVGVQRLAFASWCVLSVSAWGGFRVTGRCQGLKDALAEVGPCEQGATRERRTGNVGGEENDSPS